jgi:hypothetical protein
MNSPDSAVENVPESVVAENPDWIISWYKIYYKLPHPP